MRVLLSLSAPKEGRVGRPVEGAEQPSEGRASVPGPLGGLARWTPGPSRVRRSLFPQSSPALAWRESPWSRRAEVRISEGCRLLERKKGERLPSGWGRLRKNTHNISY